MVSYNYWNMSDNLYLEKDCMSCLDIGALLLQLPSNTVKCATCTNSSHKHVHFPWKVKHNHIHFYSVFWGDICKIKDKYEIQVRYPHSQWKHSYLLWLCLRINKKELRHIIKEIQQRFGQRISLKCLSFFFSTNHHTVPVSLQLWCHSEPKGCQSCDIGPGYASWGSHSSDAKPYTREILVNQKLQN